MNKNQLKTIVAALTYSQPTARNYPEPAKRHTDALKFATDALALANDPMEALAREIANAVVAAEVRRLVQVHLASVSTPTVSIINGEVVGTVSDEQVHVVLMDALHRVAERNGYPEWAHFGPPCNVEGTWLWVKLMDWCKRMGTAPGDQNDLFAIATEAHKLYTDVPVQGIPGNVLTHRNAWRKALVAARDAAEVSPPDVDDRAYWEHEIQAFDRTFDKLSELICQNDTKEKDA